MSSRYPRTFLLALSLQILVFLIWIPSWDVMSGDEASAYYRGLQLLHNGKVPTLEYSPFHAFYYAVFQGLFGNFYYAVIFSKAFLLSSSALLILALLTRHFPYQYALYTTTLVILALSPIQLFSIRYISLTGILLVVYLLSAESRLLINIGLVSTLLLPMIRPEYILLPFPLIAITAYFCYCSERTFHSSFVLSVGLGILGILLLGLSLAKTPSDDSRSWVAFRQHFAWGYLERHESTSSRNIPGEAKTAQIMQEVFGPETNSIGEALNSNPQAVAEHLVWNTLWLPTAGHAGLMGFVIYLGWASIGIIMLAGRQTLQTLSQSTWRTGILLLTCLAFTIPSLLLVRPRTDYLLSNSVGLMAFLACLLFSILKVKFSLYVRSASFWFLLAIGSLAVFLLGSSYFYLDYQKPGLDSLTLLDRNLPHTEFKIMTEQAICRYTASERPCIEVSFDFNRLNLSPAQTNQWLADTGINWIWFPARYRSSQPWSNFAYKLQSSPQEIDWAPIESNVEGTLYLRSPNLAIYPEN